MKYGVIASVLAVGTIGLGIQKSPAGRTEVEVRTMSRVETNSKSGSSSGFSEAQIESLRQGYVQLFGRNNLDVHVVNTDGLLMSVCFDEGTPQEVIDQFIENMKNAYEGAWFERLINGTEYRLDNSWAATTATPFSLTWSFAPDGLSIDADGIGATAPNNLFAMMDSKFASQGGRATWIGLFTGLFSRWDDFCKLSYSRITTGGNDWDDGADWGSGQFSAGQRGHLRIAARNLDGASNVLAYNFFPKEPAGAGNEGKPGNMVVDSSESWASAANQFRFMRNILLHEHGHGMGLRHLESNNSVMLMEPFLSTSIDGPQHDDVRGAMRLYGDIFEDNDTSGAATPLGALTVGGALNLGTPTPPPVAGTSDTVKTNLGLEVNGENDYFSFTVSESLTVNATVTPQGLTYNEGAQGGSQSAINSLAITDLRFDIISTNGVTVLASANATAAGSAESTSTVLPSAGTYFIRVYENGTPTAVQLYTLNLTGSTPNSAPVLNAIGNKNVNELVNLGFAASATDPNAGQTLTYSLIGAPSGATINSSTGAFSWTPTEAQGPNNYNVTVRVTDNGTPNLFDEEAITITVNEVNVAPVLNSIGNKNVNEMTTLNFTASATDSDVPANTLTYSLIGAPAGASINSSTGAFAWTPTEAQGPNVYNFTVRVTDNGTGALFDEEAIQVTVAEANLAPTLNPIGNKSGNELTNITFTATATDPDVPAQTLSYSLIGAPGGATINSSTGAFSWTPTEAQGPDVYNVTVRVTDNGTGALFDEETIQITVNEVNVAPVLGAIGNKSGDELTNITFTATASDADLPANTLTYSLIGAPGGATINSSTGAFSWTPTEAQGPNVYNVTVRVTDNGTGALFDEETIQITVNEVNVAPVLGAIGNKSVGDEQQLSFTATASDGDLPANSLTFSLIGAPAGATINGATGEFDWTPTEAQGPNVYNITIRVTDNGTGNLFDEETIQVSVSETMKVISGNVLLQDFIGNVTAQPIEVRYYEVGNPAHFGTTTLNLDGSGNFSFQLGDEMEAGTYDFAAKGSHWLRKRLGSIVVTPTGSSFMNFSLPNGDIDGDNQVTLLDYDEFSIAYDSVSGDANWNPEADLDGDGYVGLLDYDIWSGQFDQVGD